MCIRDSNQTAYDLWREIPEANFTKNFIVFCQTQHVTVIVYSSNAHSALPYVSVEVQEVQSLKWPSHTVDQFVIIKVPKADQ